MLIRLLKPMASAKYRGHEGDVIEVDDEDAEEFVDEKFAEPYFGEPPVLNPGDGPGAKEIITDPATAKKAEEVTDQHDGPVAIGDEAGSHEAALEAENMRVEESEKGTSQTVKAENPNG